MMKKTYASVATLTLMFGTSGLLADHIRVAVASNFSDTIKLVSKHFETNTGHQITLVFSSTGKHYAQIKNGPPFETFFAADMKRPQLLDNEDLALPGSRFT